MIDNANKPSRHAALSKLWADGAQIDCFGKLSGWGALDGPGGETQPSWDDDSKAECLACGYTAALGEMV